MQMKRKFMVFFIIVSIIVSSARVYADSLNQQATSIQSDIEKAKETIENISAEKDNIMVEINELNDTITKNESDISNLETRIGKLDESISFKEKDLEEKQNLLDQRLSAVYMSGGNTYLEAFFNGGIINFVSNFDIIKQIAEYDNNLMNQVKDEKMELQSSKIALENSKVELKVKQSQLGSKKAERVSKVETLNEEQKSMQRQLEEKQNELARINEAVRKATEEADATMKNGKMVEGESAVASSGGMTWPTRIEHRVNSIYAPAGRSDTSGYVGTAHKGVDIYAPSGTPIYAAKAGTVVYVNYSGYGGGWGLYVVIYHGTDSQGNPIYTRYAHASAIASGIQVGSEVTTSTIIMYAGNTGASEGAHLHFEVCIGNMYSQVNPCTYLGITNTKGSHD